MSEPVSPTSTRWRFQDLLLAELVGVVLLMTLAVGMWGARALPWTTDAEQAGRDNHAAVAAAQRAVLAFLEVDYRAIDERTQNMMDLSTAPFRDEYAYGSTDLRVATMQAKSVSTATIRAIGVKRLGRARVQLLVGADSVLRSTATSARKATGSCPHEGAVCNRYRFLATMTRVEERWLLSDLAEVP